MKIAHVVGTFMPHVGGMGQVALDECRGLVTLGDEPTVFTLRYGSVNYENIGEPFKIVRLAPLFKSGDAGLVTQLIAKLRGFDLVHLHYPFYGGAGWVWLASRLYKVPYVVTYHMDAAPVGWFKRIIQKFYDPTIGRLVLNGAGRVLVVNAEHFKNSRFGSIVDPQKVRVLGNPVDISVFKPQITTASELGKPEWENKQIILFVGNLFPGKNLELMLLALKELPPEVVLAVVGGGYAEQAYKSLAQKLGLDERVFFVGQIKNAKILSKWYSVAKVLCVPSSAESFSLVAAEALCCGCPVVGSDIPGLRARLAHGGEVFAPGSVGDLTRAIKLVLAWGTDERAKRMHIAREQMVEQTDSVAHVKKLRDIYQEVVK